jgi:hypothetical protein
VAKECPSKRAYIATDDGGYVSASHEEANVEEEPAANEERNGVLVSSNDAGSQRIFTVQCVLSTQMHKAQKQQRHNLFQILFVIKERRAWVIIDGGSCNNLVSEDLVKHLELPTRPHKNLYHI